MSKIILNKGREKSVIAGNKWIFSGAVKESDANDGEIAEIITSSGDFLGSAYYNSKTQIAARVMCLGEKFTDSVLLKNIQSAVQRRKIARIHDDTDAFRLIFSEADNIPGFIADSFASHLSIQSLTLGADLLKDKIISILVDELKPKSIYEKSDHAGRKLEGVHAHTGQLYGETPDEVIITEHGVKYPVDIKTGQKTGFFIDQRENRKLIKNISSGRTVLNLFSYTGGFSFAAIAGGAEKAVSVDISGDALEIADKTAVLNGFKEKHGTIKADIFDLIRSRDFNEDIIIIDPPAFVKSKGAIDKGCRGYKDVNMNVFKRCSANRIVLTCSCSRFVDMDLFQKIIFGAALDAKRNAYIIGKYSHPADHPVNIYHPETEYLKAILLIVE
ncbi:MAG: class I SAM-dependent rRNA methyltransferase [Spirochaetes bacterium]|nr:class I SAM-dependent rRNA methyltransferase [Spirochaetota bacterium]